VIAGATSKTGVDDEEREAVRAEGFDADEAAIVMVRWELSL
jgi:hypothetical protein